MNAIKRDFKYYRKMHVRFMVTLKLPLCFDKRHAMRTYEEVEV
jgi:hypothetical protein